MLHVGTLTCRGGVECPRAQGRAGVRIGASWLSIALGLVSYSLTGCVASDLASGSWTAADDVIFTGVLSLIIIFAVNTFTHITPKVVFVLIAPYCVGELPQNIAVGGCEGCVCCWIWLVTQLLTEKLGQWPWHFAVKVSAVLQLPVIKQLTGYACKAVELYNIEFVKYR